ncbi:MAG: hypothetical protein HUU55_17475 [Myxococcales bacterium]|nr:hypothetical protein [Myxococcales bacterium]
MKRPARTAFFYPVLLVFSSGCTETKTAEDVFVSEIIPILNSHCSSSVCHGVTPGWEERGEVIAWDQFYYLVNNKGEILDTHQAYLAAKRIINTQEYPEHSTLLRKPLPTAYGGLPHYGKDNFPTPDDPYYRKIRDWIEMETGGGEDPPQLNALQIQFRDTVQPILKELACQNANCHGPGAAVPFRLLGGYGGQVPARDTLENYAATRTMISINGDPMQSRLLRKALPLHEGGIVHKGGNSSFLFDKWDLRVKVILDWICAERLEGLGQPCDPPSTPPIRGFVFVKGQLTPHGTFDLDEFSPGGALIYARIEDSSLTPVGLENLTAGLFSEPVDIRDPAVDTTGTRLAFAVRTNDQLGHSLWTLDLVTREARQVTPVATTMPGGGLRTDRDPTWGPNGHLWFVSTRAGTVSEVSGLLDADIYELNLETNETIRRSFTPQIERRLTFFVHGEEAGGEIGFTALRTAIPNQIRAHIFRFPPDLKTEYHQHFGITPPEDVFYDMREFPDGRYVTVISDLNNVWEGGRLGVVDRNFGPEINERAQTLKPGLPFYSAPLTRLDPGCNHSGETNGIYRDPVVLPDGRILVTYAPGTISLDDPTAKPEFGIYALTLKEQPDGSGPVIEAKTALIPFDGNHYFDPEPVVPIEPARLSDEQHWDPQAAVGTIRHQGYATIDALLGNLFPSGPKTPRNDFVAVRIVEALPVTPNQITSVPAEETLFGVSGGTSFSLGKPLPQRILCELPLAADGTFHANVPPGIPFRLQGLNTQGMMVGTPHNRWFDVMPGQMLPQGVHIENSTVYAMQCAACHGAQDGQPVNTFVAPDVVTTASLTLARYQNQNPRHPLPPADCGDPTRETVDFAKQIQPILNRSCAALGCHTAADQAAGLTLTSEPTPWFSVGYENLLKPGEGSVGGRSYVDVVNSSAFGSYLAEKLLGQELGAPKVLNTPYVTHPAPQSGVIPLSDNEIRLLLRWMDLGSTYRGVPEVL